MGRITEVALDLLKKYQNTPKQDEEEEKEETYAQMAARLEREYPTKPTAQQTPQKESYAQMAARLEKEYPTQKAPQTQAPQQPATQKETYAQMAARLEKEYPAQQAPASVVAAPQVGSAATEDPAADLIAKKKAELAFWEKQKQKLYEDPDVYQSLIAPQKGQGEIDENGNEVKHSEAYRKLVAGDDEKTIAHFESQYDARIAALRKELSDLGVDKYEPFDFFQVPDAFKDGYDIGDGVKTVLGTAADAGMRFVKGGANFAEGLLDLGTHAVGWGADALSEGAGALGWDGAQKWLGDKADAIHRRASVNDVAISFAEPDKFLDGYSVFGRTSDSIIEGTGQLAANYATMGLGKLAGLGKAGTSALTYGTMGGSSMGSSMSEAYAAGASDMDAFTYGLIAGAADTATEMLFGGLGKGANIIGFNKGALGVDDWAAKKLSSLFSSQLAKNWVQWGVKASAEGFEEWLAGTIQGWGKYVTYMSDSGMSLSEILKDENRAEQFIVGFFTSSFAQAPSLHKANTAGVDFMTGLTPEEQAAIDNLVEDRIAEAEKDGSKLTGREKASVRAQVEKAVQDLLSAPQGKQTLTGQGNAIQESSVEQQRSEDLRQAVWDVMDKAKKNPAQVQTPANQKNTAPDGTEQDAAVNQPQVTESSRRLTNNDLTEYMRVGERKHVRDMKQHVLDSGDSPILTNPSEVTGFIDSALHGKVKDVVKAYGRVNNNLAEAVKNATNGTVNIDDYYLELDANRIAHIGDHVGFDKDSRNIPLTEDQIRSIPDYVDHFDDLIDVIRRKDGSVRLMLGKKINGHTIIVETVSKGRNAIHPVTAYQIDTNDYLQNYKTRAIDRSSTSRSASADTVDISRPAIAPVNNSISENAPAVNNNSKQGAVGAAEQNFSGKAAYQDLLTDENTQPDRPGDVRPMEVPKVDGYGRKVSETVANFYGAEITPDGMASAIEELVQEGALGFGVKTNAEAILEARKVIEKKGAYAVRTSITTHVANGKIADGDIEKAMLLYATFANRNSQTAQDNAAELMVDLSTMANMTGRNLQLFKMLRKMTPQGQRMAVQKAIDRYVETLNSKRGKKKQVAVSIPQELWEAYEEAAIKDLYSKTEKTEKEKAAIEDAIYKAAAAQIKASPMEKLNAWRYMSMLGNAKTQTRNFVGNALFRPLVNTKRTIGTALEAMFLERDKRTKSVLGVGKESAALLEWAKADAKKADVKKLFSYSAKTGDSARSQIDDNRKIYDTKWLEATREFVQKVPEAADNLFKRREYAVSLASFLKARGYKMGDRITADVLNEARQYAAQEALKATFNDMNDFSNMIVRMRYKGDNLAGKALNMLGEGALPFRRTPANILVRGVEYSPVNFVRSVYNMATKVRSGEMSAATAIDQMASGLTGTGLMALGYVLAQGLFGFKLVGSEDDKDKKNAGHQSYAIEIGNKSFTVDWAAPANLPVFVGANLYNAWKDKDPDTGWLMSTLSASAKTLEPMLELSCLSSLNDLIQDVSYADEDMKPYTLVSSMATSYLNQFIPTLFGQVEQALEPEKTQVYSDADDPVQRRLETTLGQMTRKLPGDLFQAKKYDAWGREEKTSGVAETAYKWFESFISPSYTSDLSDDPVDAEIMRLNEAQDINVTVKKPSKTLSYTDSSGEKHTDHRLTAEQWEVMQKEYGQTAHAVLTELMENYSYEAMTDTQKAEAFRLAYDYARETARIAAVAGYPGYSDGWMDGIKGGEANAIIEKLARDTMSDALSDLTGAWKYGRDDTEAVEAIQEAYTLYSHLTRSQAKAVDRESSGRVAGCYEAMKAGVTPRVFADLYQTYYEISGSDSKPAQKANSWAAQLQKAKEKGWITNKQMQVMKESFTFSSGFTVETEKFDQLASSGLSADKSSYVMDIIANLKPSPGRSTVSDVQEAEALAKSNLSEKDKQAAMMLYLSDTQDENLEQMVSKGYSAEDYAHVYRIYTDEKETGGKGTKARTIAGIQKILGCSYSTAEAVYKIYAS